jgi:ATP-dependent Clp protease ATP-binding subunit ClpA
MFERFTDRARRVVVLAQQEAGRLDHGYIGTEHILLGLVADGEGAAAHALASLDVSLTAVREHVEELVGRGREAPTGHVPFTERAKKVLERSLREALQLGHNYIGTEHILLGLVHDRESVASQVLVRSGADLNQVRERVLELVAGESAGGAADMRVPGAAPEVVTARAATSVRTFGSAVGSAVARRSELLARSVGQVVFRRFTVSACRVLLLAESEALRLGHSPVGVEHLLLGLLAEGEGGAARALGTLGLDLGGVRAKAEQVLGRRTLLAVSETTHREDVIDAVERSLHEALAAGSERIDTEHLLLGIVHQAEHQGTRAQAALQVLGASPAAIREAVATPPTSTPAPADEQPPDRTEGDPGG